MTNHELLLERVASIDPVTDELAAGTAPPLEAIIDRHRTEPAPPARSRRRGVLVAAAAALVVLLVGLVAVLTSGSNPEEPATDESTVTTAPSTTAPTSPPSTAPVAPPVTESTPPTIPVEMAILALPRDTDGDLAYAIVRSVDPTARLDSLRQDEGGALGVAFDSLREYVIGVDLFEDPEGAAAALDSYLEDARDPSAPLPDGGDPPPPAEFDVPELAPVRAVTYVFQSCGRGCREPEQVTEIVFAVDRATVSISARPLSDAFEDPGVQQSAVTDLAFEVEALVRSGLDGTLPDVQVARAPSLDSYHFSFGQAISESPEVMAGRTDETFWFAEAFSVGGVVVGDDLRCEIGGHFDRASPLATAAEIDSPFVVRRVAGEHSVTRFDQAAFDAFWASTPVEEWWASMEHPEWLGIDVNPTDGLANLGVWIDERGVPQGQIYLEPWRDFGYAGYPPGWVSEQLPGDDPLVSAAIDLCRLHSPIRSDAIAAALEGQAGEHYVENGRDVVWYWLDRDAAVRAGFFDADDPIETGDFGVVVDAIEPWVHSFRMDVGGPDEAMADHFRMIPPYTGLQTGMTIGWSFGAFNQVVDLEEPPGYETVESRG